MTQCWMCKHSDPERIKVDKRAGGMIWCNINKDFVKALKECDQGEPC